MLCGSACFHCRITPRTSAHPAYGWLGIRRITSSFLDSSGLRVVGSSPDNASYLGSSDLRGSVFFNGWLHYMMFGFSTYRCT
jgi:hypothetical protein